MDDVKRDRHGSDVAQAGGPGTASSPQKLEEARRSLSKSTGREQALLTPRFVY